MSRLSLEKEALHSPHHFHSAYNPAASTPATAISEQGLQAKQTLGITPSSLEQQKQDIHHLHLSRK